MPWTPTAMCNKLAFARSVRGMLGPGAWRQAGWLESQNVELE
jgi:hypothetical protein